MVLLKFYFSWLIDRRIFGLCISILWMRISECIEKKKFQICRVEDPVLSCGDPVDACRPPDWGPGVVTLLLRWHVHLLSLQKQLISNLETCRSDKIGNYVWKFKFMLWVVECFHVRTRSNVYLCLWKINQKENGFGTSLAVQWLELCTSTAGGLGLISGQGTKILHATQCIRKKKKKEDGIDWYRRRCLLNKTIFNKWH